MAERAHPGDAALPGTVYERTWRERYSFCLPFPQGKPVLDVPCGTGWGTSMLTGAESLTRVYAGPEAIRYGASRFSGVDFRVARMDALPRRLLHVLRLKMRQSAELVAIRKQEPEEFGRAKNRLEEQVQSWQQVAEQRSSRTL